MEDMSFIEREEGVREAVCVHCRGEASWRFLDDEETRVEVLCADCGRFEMARAEFDALETDMPGAEEPSE